MEAVKGLCQRIREAGDKAEIQRILDVGGRYEWASETTRRRWNSCCDRRLKELSRPAPVEVEAKK